MFAADIAVCPRLMLAMTAAIIAIMMRMGNDEIRIICLVVDFPSNLGLHPAVGMRVFHRYYLLLKTYNYNQL